MYLTRAFVCGTILITHGEIQIELLMEHESRIYYNKLVRDKIQDIIENKGETCEIREITSEREFEQELMKKIVEEAIALSMSRTREEFLHEATDLMLVLDTLNEHLKFSDAEIAAAMEENLARKGGYKKRHFLHWSEDKTYTSNESPSGVIS